MVRSFLTLSLRTPHCTDTTTLSLSPLSMEQLFRATSKTYLKKKTNTTTTTKERKPIPTIPTTTENENVYFRQLTETDGVWDRCDVIRLARLGGGGGASSLFPPAGGAKSASNPFGGTSAAFPKFPAGGTIAQQAKEEEDLRNLNDPPPVRQRSDWRRRQRIRRHGKAKSETVRKKRSIPNRGQIEA